ncbi:MAG: hypothetical protein M9962_05205 [Oligoflexia bacterium]|nr:hypothetical protein [Oligoflexia bacterium]
MTKVIKILLAGFCLSFLFSCGNRNGSGDGGIEGVGSVLYSISGGNANFSVVFENIQIDAGARIPLNKPAGAFIEIAPDFQSAGTIFKISVPLSSLFNGGGNLPVIGLPDGRPLPGVKSGALGVLPITLPTFGTTFFYWGADVFGIFFPINLPDLPFMVSSKIKDERGNLLGVIWGIPKSGRGTSSGVLFLFPVEGSKGEKFLSKSI